MVQCTAVSRQTHVDGNKSLAVAQIRHIGISLIFYLGQFDSNLLVWEKRLLDNSEVSPHNTGWVLVRELCPGSLTVCIVGLTGAHSGSTATSIISYHLAPWYVLLHDIGGSK